MLVWPDSRSPGLPLPQRHDALRGFDQAASLPEGIERADLDKAFHGQAVQRPEVDPPAEVFEGLEWSAFLARLDDRRDGCLSDVLDRGEAEANGRLAIVCVFDSERRRGMIDVRQQNPDPVAARLPHTVAHLFGVAGGRVEQGGEVLGRVVRTEVRRPVGDHGVADAVGLIEGVTGERFDEVEDAGGESGRVALLLRPGDELVALRRHDLRDLLAHRLAEDVGLAQRVPAERLGDQQDLVLVDDDAVRLLQDFLETVVWVLDRRAAVLRLDERVYVLHRAGAVECDHGGDVGDGVRLEIADVAAHATALELEHAERLAGREQFKRAGVVLRYVGKGEMLAAGLGDHRHGAVKDRQVGEAEEVHLEETDVGDRPHGELRGRRGVVVIGRGPLQRDVVGERVFRYDDAGRMGRSVSDGAFEVERGVDDLPARVVGVAQACKLGVFPERVGRVMPSRVGTSLASRSPAGLPRFNARAVSRSAARAPRVPNVMICAT